MSTGEANGNQGNRSECSSKVEIDKVSVKLPPFWTEKPDIWFCQAEAQFTIAGIVMEATKFNYLLAQLEPKFVENIWDLVTSNDNNKYSLAKERLLNIFRESEECQIKKLLSGLELGDMKPTQLLRKMRSYAGTNVSEKILKHFGLTNFQLVSEAFYLYLTKQWIRLLKWQIV